MNKGTEKGAWAKLLCSIWVYNQYNLIPVGVFLVMLFGKKRQILFLYILAKYKQG